jgi:simple sugar transport system substrate-binding protein/basic membrane protein A
MKRLRSTSMIASPAVLALILLAVVWTSAASSAGTSCTSPAGAKGPGVGSKVVGFVYVGSTSDFGYNEAAHEGAQALKKACSNLKVLEADTIPETSDMVTAAEQEIAQGAKIIFSTSYGYKDYAVTLAKKHPDVAFLQQGNYINPPMPPNANTYFGNVYETVYLGGIAAGKATKTGKLGFVAAFPIPQTLLNIDAFELGAQSVNPKVKTYVVFTGSWCDPGKQADAAKTLMQQGADVLSQHQDCTGTIIKTAEAKKAFSVGYHFNAASLAPKGWLTGSEWKWGPLYAAMVKNILAGKFTGGAFNTNFSLGFSGGSGIPSPMDLAPFGPSVKVLTKKKVRTAQKKILGGWSPFTGPIYDQTGKLQVPKGKVATGKQLAGLSYLVKGVVGTIPK